MKYKVGDRVTMINPWHDGYGVNCTITKVANEGKHQFVDLKSDEPCFDVGKYTLSDEDRGVDSQYIGRIVE